MINLAKAQLEKSVADYNYGMAKRQVHQNFVRSNKKTLIALDILFFLGFLANFGALFITHVMTVQNTGSEVVMNLQTGIVKEIPLTKFYEVNPVQSKNLGAKIHPDTQTLIPAVIKQILLWGMITMAYVYLRRHLNTEEQLTSLISMTVFGFIFLAWDFINDAGYFIGLLQL